MNLKLPNEISFNSGDLTATFNADEYGDITLEAYDYLEEDIGIGAYEYFGAIGYDSKIVKVVTEVKIVDCPEDLTKKEVESIEKAVNKAIKGGMITARVTEG